jgi:nicotinamidase-related amidase
MKPALMIIDMQKEYFTGYAKESMTAAAEYINEVVGYFREKKLPIIWVQDIDRDSGVVRVFSANVRNPRQRPGGGPVRPIGQPGRSVAPGSSMAASARGV